MPTIFDSITSGMAGNTLSTALSALTSKIGGAGSQLTALQSGQLPAVGGLQSGLSSITPPDISGSTTGFAGALSSLSSAMPSDLSSVTGGLTQALSGLDSQVSTNLVGQLQKVIGAIQALQHLVQAGFSTLPLPPAAPAGAGGPAPVGGAPAAGGHAPGGPGPAGPAPAGGGSPAPPPPDPAADARQRRLDAVKALDQSLAGVTPFTAPTFITFVHDQVRKIPRDLIHAQKIPILDDLLDLFTNVVVLRSMDATALQTYLKTTVQQLAAFLASSGAKPITDFTSRCNALAAQVDFNALKSEMATAGTGLARIGAAVSSGDLSSSGADIAAVNTALNTLLPRVAALDPHLFDGHVDAIELTFNRLPVQTERAMRRVAEAVQPVQQAQLLQTMGDKLAAALQKNPADQLATDIDGLLQPAVKALDIVNIIPIREPMLTAIDAIKSAADDIDKLLAQVASETGLLFDGVNKVLAQVDPSSVINPITQAVTDFQNKLQQTANNLFAPARTAISDAVTQISNTVQDLKVDDIVNALKDAISKLTAVLQSPDVANAVNTIHNAVQEATAELQKISFAPITDEVISGIEDITKMLKAIDPSLLSTSVKLALKAAVAVLPSDLKPVTDPLVKEFDQLVDTGPKPLLTAVEAQPAKLLAQVNAFSPASLIGDQLSKPFEALIADLEKFKPSSLLAPVEQVLNGIKDQIRRTADPGQLLQPLEDLFNQLLAQFDKLKPQDLVKPLNDALQAVIDKVLNALPTDALMNALNAVLAPFQSVRDITVAVKSVIEKVTGLVDGLADAETQIRTWLQPILNDIDQMADLTPLQPAFDSLANAVNALKADAIRTAVQNALAPVKSGITALNPTSALSTVAAAYGSVHPDALAALPASAQKTAAQAVLARFNPVSPDFSRPFNGFAKWQQEIAADEPAFEALLTHWDARYHGPNRPLNGFVQQPVTAAALKATLQDALENEIVQPLAHLLGIIQTAAAAAKPPLAKVTAFIDEFDQKLDDILTGPGALGGLRDAINTLITRLHNINLNFIVTQMDSTFQTIRGKLTAVSPTAIRTLVENAFNSALNLLDVSQLLPKAELDALDADYQKIVDDLKQFDPKKLIVDVVQPLWDSTVPPLLKAFDITALLQAAIAQLETLEKDLHTELDKTNAAYKEMLNAVPSISLADAASAVAGAVGDIAGGLGF
ncbi:MAG TPA: hypothetical protein VFA04_09225 [Bryobacteraceae bacterium]|nr:hypothetical protein [Bryobacteraceae bacterium]